jgi:exosortase N
LILGYFVKERQLEMTWFKAIGSLLFGFLLTLFANYIRLLGLVVFDIPPTNPLHSFMGIISLIVYVLVPFFFLWNWRQPKTTIFSDKSLLDQKITEIPKPIARHRLFLIVIFILGLIFAGTQFGNEKIQPVLSKHPWITLSGFTETPKAYGVLELRRSNQLIYIKPPAGPFQGAHDPRICWQGSGFVFQKIRKERVDNLVIYTAEITRDDVTLQTAWWYDNGHSQTTEEWDWRWRSLFHGERYYLINLSVVDQDAETLKKSIREVMEATNH